MLGRDKRRWNEGYLIRSLSTLQRQGLDRCINSGQVCCLQVCTIWQDFDLLYLKYTKAQSDQLFFVSFLPVLESLTFPSSKAKGSSLVWQTLRFKHSISYKISPIRSRCPFRPSSEPLFALPVLLLILFDQADIYWLLWIYPHLSDELLDIIDDIMNSFSVPHRRAISVIRLSTPFWTSRRSRQEIVSKPWETSLRSEFCLCFSSPFSPDFLFCTFSISLRLEADPPVVELEKMGSGSFRSWWSFLSSLICFFPIFEAFFVPPIDFVRKYPPSGSLNKLFYHGVHSLRF